MANPQQIVAGVLSGDPESFDAFYDLYFRRVYRFAQRRSHSRAGAEEQCAAIFRAVVARLDRWHGRMGLDAWVLGIARHTVDCEPVDPIRTARVRAPHARAGTAAPPRPRPFARTR